MKTYIGQSFRFWWVGVLITSVLFYTRSQLVSQPGFDPFSAVFLVVLVAIVAFPAGVGWPLLVRVYERARDSRITGAVGILAGAALGLVCSLLLGANGGGFWGKVAFALGFGFAGWNYARKSSVRAAEATSNP